MILWKRKKRIKKDLHSFVKKINGKYVLDDDYEPQTESGKIVCGSFSRAFPELTPEDFEGVIEEKMGIRMLKTRDFEW